MQRVRYILAWIGLAALSIYVLACRPSFSPDGRRILVPTVEPGPPQLCVQLYDIAKDRLEPVYVESLVEGEEDGIPWPAVGWTADGQEGVIVQQLDDDLMKVTVLPLAPGRVLKVFHVRVSGQGDKGMHLIHAPVMQGAWLFYGGQQVTRLDLATGESAQQAVPDVDPIWPLEQHGRLFYIGERKEKGAEAGRLDPQSLSAEPLFALGSSLASDIGPFVAFNGDGTRFATSRKAESGDKVIFMRKGEADREVGVGTPERPLRLGSMIWAKDEKSLLAAGFRPADDGVRMVLLEIPAEGGPIRETSIVDTPGDGDDDAWGLVQQIALAPDGKTVAALGGVFGEEDAPPPDRALYLVDLTTPERKVRKIPIPAPRTELRGGAE